ncbi:MAG: ABC transporter permease [Elusimicrobia bacterium]|nr:ABC transporter permease [Elusimicrobiota bacterium]
MRAVARLSASTVLVLVGIAIVAFFLIRLIPGDIVDLQMGREENNPEVAAELRRVFGLERSLPVQFVEWFTALIRADLGRSLRTGRPVVTEIASRFPQTLELTLAALSISLLVAIPAGIVSATRRNSVVDLAARLVALIGLSLPTFWLGILLIMVLSVAFRLLPPGGYEPMTRDLVRNLQLLAMPALTLGAGMAAITMRMTRSAMLEALGQDYVRTARAKGLAEAGVLYRHTLKNALIPVATVVGIQVGRLLGGTIVVEYVFSWPGLGTAVVDAILYRDYPMVQGLVMALAFFFVLVHLVVDLVYVYLDPRLRHD